MAIQIVMDHTGDTRHPFSPDDAQALAKAEERFGFFGIGFRQANERNSMTWVISR